MICPGCATEVQCIPQGAGGVCLACWIEGREPMAAALLAIAEEFAFDVEVAAVQFVRPGGGK